MQHAYATSGRQFMPVPAHAEQIFLLHWGDMAMTALMPLISDETFIARDAVNGLLTELLAQLHGIARDTFETLKNEFMAHDNALLKLDPRLATAAQRQSASDWLTAELERTGGNMAFERAPLLKQRLDHATARFTTAIGEMLARLRADRADICATFFCGADFGNIARLDFVNADPHFHGRRTCIVSTSSGAFVYKPRDCRADGAFHDIAQRWFADSLTTPRCIPRDGYGYLEFMKTSPVATRADVALYFERLGSSCALLHALGSSDLHADNWICCDGHPALVDLETILTPLPHMFGERDICPEQHDAFRRDIDLSLVSNGILPSRRGNVERSVLLDSADGSKCLPVLDGVRHTVHGFESSFLAGFDAGYRRCMALKNQLIAVMEGFRELPLRRIIRNTDVYAALLHRLNTLPALSSPSAQRQIVDRLGDFLRKHGAEQLSPVAEREAQCLLDGDIPYFSSSGGGHALMCGGDVIYADFFRLSAVENAVRRISMLSDADLRFERGLLAQGMARAIVPDASAPITLPAPAAGTMTDRDALDAAVDIFRQIESMLLTSPRGAASWMVMSESTMSLIPSRPVLSNGTAGMGVFFAALAAVDTDRNIVRRARALTDLCLEQIDRYVQLPGADRALSEAAVPLGIAKGMAGVLRALTLIDRYANGDMPRRLAERVVNLIGRTDLEHARQTDVYSGTAGLLLALCQWHEQHPSDSVAHQLRRCAARLAAQRQLSTDAGPLWDTLGRVWPVSGLGHGMAGIAAALMSAAHALCDMDYARAALDALMFEHRIYSDKLKTWPDLRDSSVAMTALHGLCSGAPGIGLALLSCQTHWRALPERPAAFIDEDIAKAIRVCTDHAPLYRDHLCCGNAAAVEFMLSLPQCRPAAGRLLAFMVHRMKQTGCYNYLPPGFKQTPAPELLYAASGIGYELLRSVQPDILAPILL